MLTDVKGLKVTVLDGRRPGREGDSSGDVWVGSKGDDSLAVVAMLSNIPLLISLHGTQGASGIGRSQRCASEVQSDGMAFIPKRHIPCVDQIQGEEEWA